MLEVSGDLWTHPARVRCITTNGDINKAGLAVMGRGVALQATQRYGHNNSALRQHMAYLLKKNGNYVQFLGVWTLRHSREPSGDYLISFPVKHHWQEKADLDLIQRSARELRNMADRVEWMIGANIVLPRPGCGNGGLLWEDVKPILEPILDDRFHVIERA